MLVPSFFFFWSPQWFFRERKPVSETLTRATVGKITQTGKDGAFVNQKQTFQPTISKIHS